MAGARGSWKNGKFIAKPDFSSLASKTASRFGAYRSDEARSLRAAYRGSIETAVRTRSPIAVRRAVNQYIDYSNAAGSPKTREQAESFVLGRIGEGTSGVRRSPFRNR